MLRVIKSIEDIRATLDEDDCHPDGCCFASGMELHCGKTYEFRYNEEYDRYFTKGNHWTWMGDWLEPCKKIYLGGE